MTNRRLDLKWEGFVVFLICFLLFKVNSLCFLMEYFDKTTQTLKIL